MKISIITLFPEMFQGPLDFSIIKRAMDKKIVEISYINIRDFGIGKHKVVDDTPYGGGIGMVMRPDVLHAAISHAKEMYAKNKSRQDALQKVVLLDAAGKTYNQEKAVEFTNPDHLILVCGHYEGVDERIRQYVDEEISIGDFITTGGEIPAMLIIDSVIRLLPGVLKPGATDSESFSLTEKKGGILLEYPHYTQPRIFNNMSVPDILLSGNHKKIQQWRMQQALKKTSQSRPNLLRK